MAPDFTDGNRLALLENGGAYFPALLAAFDAAQSEINLETYIFADDETGRQVAAALVRAAGRGVLVRVLVDGFGSPCFEAKILPGLLAAGVRALVYRRFKLFPAWGRLHRKVAQVDGRTAFVGGINIVDDDPRRADCAPFRLDYAVAVAGPLVVRIREDVCRLWNRTAWRQLKQDWRMPHVREHGAAGPLKKMLPWMKAPGAGQNKAAAQGNCVSEEISAAWVVRNSVRHRRDIEKAYLKAIREAKRDILLANAYFLPGWRFRRALAEAAGRGVRVTVLTQGVVEYPLAHYASQEIGAGLLAAGVRLFAYRRSFLHAKVAVVDGRWATVGSSNIDPLSMLLAREANVVVRDPAFAARLQAGLEQAMREGAHEIRAEDLRQSPWRVRLSRRLAHTVVRLLAGLAGWH